MVRSATKLVDRNFFKNVPSHFRLYFSLTFVFPQCIISTCDNHLYEHELPQAQGQVDLQIYYSQPVPPELFKEIILFCIELVMWISRTILHLDL